ncbi:hypothetical protein Esti_001011 [Eimeria stiedai]
MSEDFEWANDYAFLCSPYGFRVHAGPRGKELRATVPYEPGEVLLSEVPLVVWPVRTSASQEAFACCENCMRIKPFNAEGGGQPVKTQRFYADAAAAVHTTPQESAEAATRSCQTNGTGGSAANQTISIDGEDPEAGISVYRAGTPSPLWFCSSRCCQQALGGAANTPGVPDAEEEGGLQPTCTSSPLRKRDPQGFVKACSRSSSSSGSGAARRVFGWQEFLSPEGLHALRRMDSERVACWESNPGPAGGEVGSPIGLEALGRVVARVAATAASLHQLHQWELRDAYAEACRPFLRLVAAEQEEALKLFNAAAAAKRLEEVMEGSICAALGEEVAAALLGVGALAFFFGALMRNAQTVLIWGATEKGSLMVLRAAGVYVLQACCNHSCVPNCAVENGGDACICLKAERRIEAGEELTIAYVPLSLAQPQRQCLLDGYQFICDCMRCQEERQGDPQQRS